MGGADQTTHGRTMQYRRKRQKWMEFIGLDLRQDHVKLFSFNVPVYLSTGTISQIQ